MSGRRDDALECLTWLQERAQTSYVSAAAFAYVLAGLGQMDEAFEYLDRAVGEQEVWSVFGLVYLPVIPLQSDPCFAELRGRIGL